MRHHSAPPIRRGRERGSFRDFHSRRRQIHGLSSTTQRALGGLQHSYHPHAVQAVSNRLLSVLDAFDKVTTLLLQRLVESEGRNRDVANANLKLKLGETLRGLDEVGQLGDPLV